MTKLIIIPTDVQRSAPDGTIVYRTLDTNSDQNKDLPSVIQSLVDSDYSSSTQYTDDKFPQIKTVEQLQKILSELIIRFDTKPDYYTKKDYQLLITLLTGAISFFNKRMTIISDNNDIITILTDDDNRTVISPQVGRLTDSEDENGNYIGQENDNNEKSIATVGDIRNYINNKLTWIEQ